MKTAGDILSEKGGKLIGVPHDMTIYDALAYMIEKKVGAIIVMKDSKAIGIWTSRDLMRNTVAEGFDAKASRVEEYMTKNILSAPHTDTAYNLMDKLLGLRINHLLVEKDGEYIGLISIGDVLRAGLLEKDRQFKDINDFVSWDYYENWRAGRQK